MYKATVTKSLSDLKRLDHIPILISACMAGAMVGFFGPELTIYSLILLLFIIAIWLLTGQLQWRPQKGELILTETQLRLKWLKCDEVILDLKEVSPKFQLKTYRPLGILPKKEYIHLMLDGGPLGPHEYFFFHDGEYNAKQWDQLPIGQVSLGSSLSLAE